MAAIPLPEKKSNMAIEKEKQAPDVEWTLATLKEYLLATMQRNDEKYTIISENQRRSVVDALAAQKELTAAANAASEKAILKSEEAQREYNVRSNEFRGQLDDQAKTLMPRIETENRFTTIMSTIKENRVTIDKIGERLTAIEANGTGMHNMWGYVAGAIGLVAIVVTLVMNIYRK